MIGADKRDKQNMKRSTHRRIITANVDGKSVVQSDEQLSAYEFSSVPGYEHTFIWVNQTTPDLPSQGLIAIPIRSYQDLAVRAFTS
jgi:hypothetical protein